MKKMANRIAVLISALTLGQVCVSTGVQVQAATDASSFKVSNITTKKITLSDGSQAVVHFNNDDHMSGSVDYEGETKKFIIKMTSAGYEVYLDDELVYSTDGNHYLGNVNNVSPFINFSYANGKPNFTHKGRKYYYLTTEKYNTYTGQKWINIAKDLIGFIPIVGNIANTAQLIKDILGNGEPAKKRWYTVKEYCTWGYEYYAWKTYTYSDAKRKHLISVKWTYEHVLKSR